MWLYVPGKRAPSPHDVPPGGRETAYTVWHQIELNPGEQYTLAPDTLHWFQAGPDGAVVSEFSTRSLDAKDVFTDPEIARITRIAPGRRARRDRQARVDPARKWTRAAAASASARSRSSRNPSPKTPGRGSPSA